MTLFIDWVQQASELACKAVDWIGRITSDPAASYFSLSVRVPRAGSDTWAPCQIRGPFPGRMSQKATKPGSVCHLS